MELVGNPLPDVGCTQTDLIKLNIIKSSQILELVGNPLPDVGCTQPDYHRWPRHQHRYLGSIGEEQSHKNDHLQMHLMR